MRYYLSSYKFGNDIQSFIELIPTNNKIGHINNARDFVVRDVERADKNQQEEITFLNSVGFEAEVLDLKVYFNNPSALNNKLNELGGIWVSGGNTFVLRQAMQLSGFDKLFPTLIERKDFLYGGYSAGICILSKSLKIYALIDDDKNFPYPAITETIYEGLEIFEDTFLPHFESDHPESELIGKAVQYCTQKNIPFKTLRDGEVLQH